MINARTEVYRLLDNIPDDKMIYVLSILQNMTEFAMEEVAPDALDLQLLQEAEQDDEKAITFDEAVKRLGFDVHEFQN